MLMQGFIIASLRFRNPSKPWLTRAKRAKKPGGTAAVAAYGLNLNSSFLDWLRLCEFLLSLRRSLFR